MSTCHICVVDLFDDPHYDEATEELVCDRHCSTCLPHLPGDGSAPDEAPSPATGDDRADTHAVVPAAGGSSC